MDRSTDTEVVRTAVDWLDEGSRVILATVAQTWGSAPRRPGALMAIHADGRFVGSVSGGCIEDDLVQRVLRGEFEPHEPELVEYGVNTAATRRVGLPCGGRLRLLVECIDAPAQLRRVLASMENRERVLRRVCLETGESSLHPAGDHETFTFDGDDVCKVFGPAWRMLIIGAGELSRRVSQLALTLDYAVTICDSRPEYAEGWEVEGTAFTTIEPAVFIDAYAPDARTVILALAHAPVLEDAALAVALRTDAFYIGALGSIRNKQARVGRLRRMGLSTEQIGRLHGPVGLDIGSRTPAEIAVSVTAALIEARNCSARSRPRAEAVHG